jgi:hypothetical protein
MEKVRIYRGSFDNSPSYSVVENYPSSEDVYGGVFGSSDLQAAASHGNDAIHYTDIPIDGILTNHILNYEIPSKKAKAALLKARPDLKNKPKLFDELYDIVLREGQDLRNLDDDKIRDLFRMDDFGEASNEAQRLRGQVSKNLGFKAVEMTDEHGSGSYLVSPGAKFYEYKD